MKMSTFDPNAGRSSGGPDGGGVRVSLKDLIGLALLVKVRKHSEGVSTKFGEKDAIDVDFADIASGRLATDQRWFNGAVVSALAPYVGQIVPVKPEYTQGSGPFPYIVVVPVSEIEAAAAQKLLNEKNPFGQDQDSPLPEASTPDPTLVPADAPRW